MRTLVISFLILCVLLVYTSASKYSKSANDHDLDIDYEKEERPFRMKKVNLLWAKGKKKLSSEKLADLYAELSVHDKHEAQLKKMRAANKDQDGALEAKVLKSYARIVKQFDLEESNILSNEIPFDEELEDVEKEHQFQDPKLQDMWRKAQEAGFNKKDLFMLKEEFQHQQMKIHEFNFLLQELGSSPELLEDTDPYENVVDPDTITKEGLGEEELKERELIVRGNHTKIKEGYQRLETLVSAIGSPEPEFKDTRVYKLWAMAKKTNWSTKEMDSFKEELKHFEHRLSKLTYYKEKLDQSEEAIDRIKEKGMEVPEKHQKLLEKNEFLDRTVNKLYTDLKARISKSLKHIEL